MGLVDNNFTNQLTQAIKYLSQKTDKYETYIELINKLKSIQEKIANYQIKVTIVSEQQKIIDIVKNLSLESQPKNYVVTSIAISTPINEIIQNCDLILLVLDSTKSITSKEDRLIQRAISSKISLGIIVKQNTFKQHHDFNLAKKYQTELNVLNFLENNSIVERYNSFFALLFNKSISYKLLNFKQDTIKTINHYFETNKKITWQQIQQRKDLYLLGENPDKIQQIINQLIHRCNRLTQNYLRVFKQNNNQNKLNIINPFFGDSLMYRVQNTIQDAEVISQKGKQKTYLRLLIKHNNNTQAIHTYVMEVCQQSLETWLDSEWHNINTQYNDGGLNRLQQQLQLEIQPLGNLSPEATLLQPEIKPQLQLENYICLSALENNSKIDFDYHYVQSTWFRLLVAVSIGTVIYLLTERLFGFILLLVQIINLITGQDTKSVRLRQQTKELKRIVDGRYQFLVRFLTDNLVQEIAIALDGINQDYQEQITNIIQSATKKLQEIKQDINTEREKIDELKKSHQKIQKIFKP